MAESSGHDRSAGMAKTSLNIQDLEMKDGNPLWKDDTIEIPFMTTEDSGEPDTSSVLTDERELLIHGKVSDYVRVHDFWSMLGMATIEMLTWECVMFSGTSALFNGGPPALVFGLVFSWLGALATTASLAELCSIAPVAAGQYHWVWMLAPKSHKKFLSWITGWIGIIGWNINTSNAIVFAASLLASLITVGTDVQLGSTELMQRFYTSLLVLGILLLCVVVNTICVRYFPAVGRTALAIHIMAFVALLVPLAVRSHHISTREVFVHFQTMSGWQDHGVGFLVGILGTNLAFIGSDAPAHLVEEVKSASRNAPRAMVWAVILNGFLGFCFCIVFAFSLTDKAKATQQVLGSYFVGVFLEAVGHNGALTMASVLFVLTIFTCVAFVATAARQTRAFARDNGLPMSRHLKQLKTINQAHVPLNGIIVAILVTIAICLLNIASSVALNAITSLAIAAFYLSYLIPIVLLTLSRLRGERRTWGRWTMNLFGFHIPGMGLVVNIFSIMFILVSVVFSFFPVFVPVTIETMNWSCVVFPGFVLVGVIYWFARGRTEYHGVVHEKDVFAVPFAV